VIPLSRRRVFWSENGGGGGGGVGVWVVGGGGGGGGGLGGGLFWGGGWCLGGGGGGGVLGGVRWLDCGVVELEIAPSLLGEKKSLLGGGASPRIRARKVGGTAASDATYSIKDKKNYLLQKLQGVRKRLYSDCVLEKGAPF